MIPSLGPLSSAVCDIASAHGWPNWATTLSHFVAGLLEEEDTPDITVLTLPTAEGAAVAIAHAIAAAELARAKDLNGANQDQPLPDAPVSYRSTNYVVKDADRSWVTHGTSGPILHVGSRTGESQSLWWGAVTPVPVDLYPQRPSYTKIQEDVRKVVERFDEHALLSPSQQSRTESLWIWRYLSVARRPIVVCGATQWDEQVQKLGSYLPPVGRVGEGHIWHGRSVVYRASATSTIPEARLTILDGHSAARRHWISCPRPALILLDRRFRQAADLANTLEDYSFAYGDYPELRDIAVEEMHLARDPRVLTDVVDDQEDDGSDPF